MYTHDRGIRAAITRAIRTWRAQKLISRIDRKIADTYSTIVNMEPGRRRADELFTYAGLHWRQATVYSSELPPIKLAGEPRTWSESLTWSAALVNVLAVVEAAALSGTRRSTPHAWDRMNQIEARAGWILDQMETTADHDARWKLLDDLYERVTPLVGAEAAETIGALAPITPAEAFTEGDR